MKYSIKAIVFDLGNVLVDFDHMLACKRLENFCSVSAKELYNLFFDSPLTSLFEEGRIGPEEFFCQIKKRVNLRISYEEFIPIWNEIFFLTPKNHAVYKLAKSLKSNYPLCLASNINVLHFEYLKNKFSLFDIFNKLFLSYQLKLRKPSVLIYKIIMRDLNLKAEEIFYTDDRAELVAVAKDLGMRASVFLDVEGLKNDLINHGVRLTDSSDELLSEYGKY